MLFIQNVIESNLVCHRYILENTVFLCEYTGFLGNLSTMDNVLNYYNKNNLHSERRHIRSKFQAEIRHLT